MEIFKFSLILPAAGVLITIYNNENLSVKILCRHCHGSIYFTHYGKNDYESALICVKCKEVIDLGKIKKTLSWSALVM